MQKKLENKKILSIVFILNVLFYNNLILGTTINQLQSLSSTLSALNKKIPKLPYEINITSQVLAETKKLLNDFQNYITTNIKFHAGDLYEHSIWVANAAEKFWQDKAFWVNGLNEKRDKKLSIIAALVHDIGKGGDFDNKTQNDAGTDTSTGKIYYMYYDKPEHPYTGFQYLARKKDYKMVPNPNLKFDFSDYLKNKLKLNDEDRKLLYITTGMHWKFGGTMKDISKGMQENKAFEKYLNQLRCYAIKSGYRNGVIDERLIRMCILVSAADVLGVIPIFIGKNIFNINTPTKAKYIEISKVFGFKQHKDEYISSCKIPSASTDPECRKNIAYFKYKFYEKGKEIRDKLLDYFKNNKKELSKPLSKNCKIDEKN